MLNDKILYLISVLAFFGFLIYFGSVVKNTEQRAIEAGLQQCSVNHIVIWKKECPPGT